MPPVYTTRTEVENMIMKSLQAYETKVVQPRHEDNQKILRRIERVLWIGYGVVITVMFIIENTKK